MWLGGCLYVSLCVRQAENVCFVRRHLHFEGSVAELEWQLKKKKGNLNQISHQCFLS